MRVAIIHDWLVVYGGAERVLEQMLQVFPDADIFTLIDFLPSQDRRFLHGKRVQTSFLQKLPFARRKYRYYLSYMPLAVEQFDLNSYDLVLSSSSAVAKGVITGPDQLHICVCHSPMRYAWDMQHEYLSEAGIGRGLKTLFVRKVLHDLRLWDYRTSAGVDHFIAISEHISRRIWKVYRREAEVIYPPVDIRSFIPGSTRDNYYLAVSRFVPYKKMDLIAEAFSQMPDKNLVLIGDGPEMKKIKINSGGNVKVLGYQTSTEVIRHMQQAKALVFAALEDFGIVLVEAQACGTPVIAYGRGGALESLNGLESDRPTGVFFHRQDASALVDAVMLFEKEAGRFSPDACRQNSLRFSQERFRQQFKSFVIAKMTKPKISYKNK